MEVLEVIKNAPEWVGLFIALGWIVYLREQINHLQQRLERISDRQEMIYRSMLVKLTKTDLNEP